METWHVYQFRSDTELLYVGYTRRLNKRISEHKRQKSWWPEVTRTQSEPFTSEDDARQREREIWQQQQPKYNKHSPFLTTEEQKGNARRRVQEWYRANPGRKREYDRKYNSDPVNRERKRSRGRAWARRNRPTTAEGRRAGTRRWQQSGPGLFD